MNLILRKIAYAILGSGALGSGLLAVMGFMVSAAVLATRTEPMTLADTGAMLLAMAACACGIAGPIAGIATIIALPVRTPTKRLVLSGGIAAGCISIAPLLISWLGEGDVWLTLYVAVLPLLVGFALLAELWRPTSQASGLG